MAKKRHAACYNNHINYNSHSSVFRVVRRWVALLTLTWVAQAHATDVTLAWDPDPAPTVAGYRLHCGTASGVYTQTIEIGTATTNLVSNLVDGLNYFFAVTAYDSNAVESPPSNEIVFATPGAPPIPTPTPTPTPVPTPTPIPTPTPTPTPIPPPPTPTPTPSSTPFTPPIISLSTSGSSISPGQTTTLTFTASTANPNAPIAVNYSMSGKAILGTQYTLSGNYRQVTIPAGATSASVTLTALTPTITQRSQKLMLSLLSGTGYRTPRSKKITLTIGAFSVPKPSPTPTPGAGAPAPVLISATASTPGTIDLHWSGSDQNPGWFQIFYGPAPGQYTNTFVVYSPATSATVTGLLPGTAYYFSVAFGELGPNALQSGRSNELSCLAP